MNSSTHSDDLSFFAAVIHRGRALSRLFGQDNADDALETFKHVALTQGSPAWHAWRQRGIGASDASTIMGENPWKTPAQLMAERLTGGLGPTPNRKMRLGLELEPYARRLYAEWSGCAVEPACVQNTSCSWLRASLDGLSHDRRRAVEIKCGYGAYRRTADSGEVPAYYYGQLQHALSVTGLGEMDYVCHFPPYPTLFLTVERDEVYIERLRATEAGFWAQLSRARGEAA